MWARKQGVVDYVGPKSGKRGLTRTVDGQVRIHPIADILSPSEGDESNAIVTTSRLTQICEGLDLPIRSYLNYAGTEMPETDHYQN